MIDNKLRLIEWNANGIRNKKIHFFDYLIENHIHIACICETKLKPEDRLAHKEFKIYRLDCEDSSTRGGVALIHHKSLYSQILPDLKLEIINAIGVKMKMENNTFIKIYSVYFTGTVSRHDYEAFERDIRKLTNVRDCFIVGDLNSKHQYWGCTGSNRAGRILYEELLASTFEIFAPPEPTYYPGSRRTPSILDIIISTSSLEIEPISIAEDIGSDHLPVLIEIISKPLYNPNYSYNSNHRKVNWSRFRRYQNDHINMNDYNLGRNSSTDDIDNSIQRITRILCDGSTSSVYQSRPDTQTQGVSSEIRTLIQRRNAARRRFIRNRNPILLQEYQDLKQEVEHRCQVDYNNNFQQKLSTFTPNHDHNKKLWSLTKNLKAKKTQIPPLKHQSDLVMTDFDKAELLANTFLANHDAASTIRVPLNIKTMVEDCVNQLSSTNTPEVPVHELIRPKDLKKIIKSLPNNKAPGEDGITNMMLKNATRKCLVVLTKIFNACIINSYFPSAWKVAITVPILKPGKLATCASSYRPISLLSILGKVFERLLLPKLKKCLETSQLLPDTQFGFRSCHSTTQQIKRVTKEIKSNLNQKCSTGMVLLDIKSAFDSAWHDAIIFKMWRAEFPIYLVKLIQSFLFDRSYKVKLGSACSNLKFPSAGVPQGAVLSPLLFNILINDIPTPVDCSLAQFADDNAIITSSKKAGTIRKRLQNGLKSLDNYYTSWKLKLQPQKTKAVFFTRRYAPRAFPRRNLNLNNQEIMWQENVKYLGVILDRKLTFKEHIDNTIIKSGKIVRMLYSILNRNSRLNINNKLLIYKTVLQPILLYGAAAWGDCARTHIRLLQRTQNRILKMCMNKHWRYSTIDLHNEAKTKMIDDKILTTILRFNEQCQYSENPLIANLPNN